MTLPMARLTGILARVVAGSTIAAAVTLLATPAARAQNGPAKSASTKPDSAKKAKSDSSKRKDKDKDNDSTPKAPKLPAAPLFKTNAVLEATLKFNIKAVKKEKGDNAPWHAAVLS